MEAVSVAHEAPQQRGVQRLPAEPHARPVPPERLRLEVDVCEAEVASLVGRGSVAPGGCHGLELLVEDGAATVERHAECLVLLLVPTHGRLDDQPPLAEQVERRQLLGEQQRVAQREDDGRQRDAQARRGCRNGRGEDERVGPRSRRILVAGCGVVARVAHDPFGARGRAEHDVLAEHHRVDPRRLGLDGDAHEGAEVTR